MSDNNIRGSWSIDKKQRVESVTSIADTKGVQGQVKQNVCAAPKVVFAITEAFLLKLLRHIKHPLV